MLPFTRLYRLIIERLRQAMSPVSESQIVENDKVFERLHCNSCNKYTRHHVCFKRVIPGQEKIGQQHELEISWCNTYMIASCCGCEAFTFVHWHWFSEETDGTGRPEVKIDLYPNRISRKTPAWMNDVLDRLAIPESISNLVHEIYAAMHQNLFSLASMGARSLIEKIMADKVGDHGTFSRNMDKFMSEGYMASGQRTQLEAALQIGHAVIHRGFVPTRPELETVLDIAESLIAALYVHPRRAISLQERVPRRQHSRKNS